MGSWHLVIDVDLCEDCNNCFLACKDEHVDNDWPGYAAPQPRHGQRWIDILRKERGRYPLVDAVYLPVPCMHCDTAPCIAAGAGAVRKRDDGIVLIDPARARGMRDLPASCPYGAIFWDESTDLPQKCTLCAHLLDQGWSETRCTQACPTGALRLVYSFDAGSAGAEAASAGRSGASPAAASGLEVLHPEYGTRPRVLYRNLRRWDSHLVCGSVTVERDGLVECAAGATAELWPVSGPVDDTAVVDDAPAAARGDDPGKGAGGEGGAAPPAERVPLASTRTDAFGDFRFDGLNLEPGDYSIAVALDGHAPVSYEVRVAGSCNVGVVHLEEVAS